jgi:hypothetical protein
MSNIDEISLIHSLPRHKKKLPPQRGHSQIKGVAIHHVGPGGDVATFEGIANYHVKEKNWPTIAYTYGIDRDGRVYKLNFYTDVTYHVGHILHPRQNWRYLGVLVMGDLDRHPMTIRQEMSLMALVGGNIFDTLFWLGSKDVLGHRETPGPWWGKSCPGKYVDMNDIRMGIKEYAGR